jgi:hypothetical protein
LVAECPLLVATVTTGSPGMQNNSGLANYKFRRFRMKCADEFGKMLRVVIAVDYEIG